MDRSFCFGTLVSVGAIAMRDYLFHLAHYGAVCIKTCVLDPGAPFIAAGLSLFDDHLQRAKGYPRDDYPYEAYCMGKPHVSNYKGAAAIQMSARITRRTAVVPAWGPCAGTRRRL